MNKEQYKAYENKGAIKKEINIDEKFGNDFEGTLLHGCIIDDGDMFHLYVKDGFFNLVVYYSRWGQTNIVEHVKTKVLNMEIIVKGKRAYPEASSWDFVSLLLDHNVKVCLGSFNDKAISLNDGTFYPTAMIA